MSYVRADRVAQICRAAPRTVEKWADAGHLGECKKDPRAGLMIPREPFIRFLKKQQMIDEQARDCFVRFLLYSPDLPTTDGIVKCCTLEQSFVTDNTNQVDEVVGKAAEFEPDCVVFDLITCHMDGVEEACASLRESHPDVLIIVMLPPVDLPRALDMSAVNETFKRPIEFTMLQERIHNAIGARKELI